MGKKGSLNISTLEKYGGSASNSSGNGSATLQQRGKETTPEKSVSSFRSILPQILAVNVKNVLLFGYGMTLGFPTILIPAIQGGEGRESTLDTKLHLSKEEISWLSSINLICVPLGCIFSGSLAQPLGRRRAMQFVNLPILAAWLCFHFSTEVKHLYIGLCLAGLSGGLLEAPVLTYVAEVTTPRVRGLLAASGSFCAILGVFVQFLMGTFLKWRLIALISVAAPIVSFILLFFVPESPHWLIQKNRLPEAQASLAWLRGWVPVEEIRAEYETIYANVTKSFGQTAGGFPGKLRVYGKRSFLYPYFIITVCFFIGHFSGMTTLQTYAVQIFHTLKAPIDKYYATMLLGIAELLGTFICILLVHYTGKRPIVLVSTIGVGFCFLGTATYAYFLNEIPGESISNVVANSSDILSKPLHAVLNETLWSEENAEELLDEMLVAMEDPLERFEFDPELNSTYSDYPEYSDGPERVSNTGKRPSPKHLNRVKGDSQETATSEYQFDNETITTTEAADSENDDPVQPNLPENFLLPVKKHAENKFLWVPLTLLLGSAVLSHAGIRLIPWMLIGEIYPTAVRGGASGLSGGTGYIFGFLSNKLFLKLLSTLTLPGTFWMYSCVSLCGAVVLYFIIPETEGRSLVDIEEHFTGGRKLKESKPPRKNKRRRNCKRQSNCIEGGEGDYGLTGNFRRSSSCKVSNVANQQNCSTSEYCGGGDGRRQADDDGKEFHEKDVEQRHRRHREQPVEEELFDEDDQGVVIVVPDRRYCSTNSIGNTLPPIMIPLEVQNVKPSIHVNDCSPPPPTRVPSPAPLTNQTIDSNSSSRNGNGGTKFVPTHHHEQQQQQRRRRSQQGEEVNGSEIKRANDQMNQKRFEQAVEDHEGAEWLKRIKEAHNLKMDHQHHVLNAGLGMKKKRTPK